MFDKNIKIAFFGNSEFSLIVLQELKKNGIIPDLIITTPDKPQGRKMIFIPTPTKTWAEENSIEYIEPDKLKDEKFLEKIKNYNLFIVASYGKIIPKIIIDIPKYQVLNIHPSLLPKYRGPSPLQEQILNNEKKIGVSIILIDEQIDHGAIIAQKRVEIKNWPVGFFSLQEILAKEGSKLLVEILSDWIKEKLKIQIQNDNEATFTKKIEKEDGLIVFNNKKPQNKADLISVAQQSWLRGTAQTNVEKEIEYKNYLKILAFEEWPKTYFERQKKDSKNNNIGIQKKIRVIIKKAIWKNNMLEIQRVIPEGKKEMDYSSFLLGY
ncbi:MAG: methionyl-tRNA formyltransferase [bacterium]